MDNFALRRMDAARFLAQTQVGWFDLLESRTEGMSATSWLNAICIGAPLFGKPRPNVAYRRQP